MFHRRIQMFYLACLEAKLDVYAWLLARQVKASAKLSAKCAERREQLGWR